MQLHLPTAIYEGFYKVTPPLLKMLIFANRSPGEIREELTKPGIARLESTGRNVA